MVGEGKGGANVEKEEVKIIPHEDINMVSYCLITFDKY